MLKTEKHTYLDVNPENFNAMRYVDRNFTSSLSGLEITDQKKRKLGTVLGSQYNIGTAIIDMPKLYKSGEGGKAEYFIGDKQVIMW